MTKEIYKEIAQLKVINAVLLGTLKGIYRSCRDDLQPRVVVKIEKAIDIAERDR